MRPRAERPAGTRSAGGPQPDIFAVGRGQYENIGDIILRRPLLGWAREHGRLHVYTGNSPEGYDDGLGVTAEDRVYRSFRGWYVALLRSALAGRARSIYKPGEIQLTLVGMKEHLIMLPAAALVRLRGGSVSRIGAGARNFAPLPRAIMWPSNALSSYTRWRDDGTARYLGFGAAMPDLGFAEGLSDEALSHARVPEAGRDLLVVSLRDDVEVAPRPYPSAPWLEGLRRAARELHLRLCVVTQITVDEKRSRRLAADLDAELVGWSPTASYVEQEARLREVYRRTAVVASDRLHVLIGAFTEGAVPVSVQLDDDDKIARHFSTIGVEDIGGNSAGLGAGELAARVRRVAARRTELFDHLLDARARLAEVRRQLGGLLGARVQKPVEAAAAARS